MSKREVFLQYKLAKSGIDKCLIVMSILDTESTESGFSLEDTRSAYKAVKERPPKNISDTIAKLEEKGFIQTLSGEGKFRMYSLTNSGENAVEKLKEDDA